MQDEEHVAFLPGETDQAARCAQRQKKRVSELWRYSTAILGVLLLVSLYASYWTRSSPSYRTGFDTDLAPATSAIRLKKVRFSGGIVVNESSQFELLLDAEGARYTGHPTPELDAAWDHIVGQYIALTKSEAENIAGHVSEDHGSFFAVTHVRHSLHCINYLRKVVYDKWYPTIRHENRPNVPTFWQHADHCIEILRQTIQCQSDLTPVPHVWSEGKQMYLADTSLEHTCRDNEALIEWQSKRGAVSTS